MLTIEQRHLKANRAPLPRPSDTQILARADLLFAVRDLVSPPSPASRDKLEDLAAEAGELVAAAGLDDAAPASGLPLSESLAQAAQDALAQPDGERAAELLTWSAAATGLDLCECAYVRRDRGAILGDIAGFYAAFGVRTVGAETRPDELVRELEFLALLHMLRMRARGEGDVDAESVVAEAADDFWTEHLGAWVALPAARGDILPVPTWLNATLHAVRQVCAAVAMSSGWSPPSWDDQGEGDGVAPDDVGCAIDGGVN
ncbi:MAG: molecular chaperone TorD family protein [Deltaproteobacteria bacterium]|nr:molecular chaperone TorD family protein [Deltaproteobacteria bacterium]